MKICLFTDTFLPTVGGAELNLHHLALHLSKQNEVIVLAPMAGGKRWHQEFPYPVRRYIPPRSKRFMVRQTLLYLIWLHLRHGFDLLHCHAAYPQAYVGATFKKWFPMPVVVRPHGSDIVPNGRMRSSRRLEDRLARGLTAADAIVAQGQYLQDIALDLGVKRGQVHIIHNGVGLAQFKRAAPYPHPNPYILAVGSLIKRKGFDILLNAYCRLSDPKPDLLIAGAGPEGDCLNQLSRSLQINDKVFFLGLIKGQEKIQLYRSAVFLVCPSRKEPFANVVIEALAADLPVIASAVDGNLELVKDGQNGLLCESENQAALRQTMALLLGDTDLAGRLRANARASIKAFDWSVITEQYLNLYRQLTLPYQR
jgi:glycogen(starch) synthase